jgi:uncharacterized protein with NRDE domain
MCLIVFSYNQHEKYKLILAANRDEFYERPTSAMHFWDEHPDLLAGKDLKAGGTWMGLHRDGRFAALTNYRDPSMQKENPPSRGELVKDFLLRKEDPESYLHKLNSGADRYDGFNLLTLSSEGLFHFSNRNNIIQSVSPGIHGLSNALLNTPWPKVEKARQRFSESIEHSFSEETLFDFLTDSEKAAEEHLPSTGIPKEWEKAVSSIFIKTDGYGTRSSTVLTITYDGEVQVIERRYEHQDDQVKEEQQYQLQIPV